MSVQTNNTRSMPGMRLLDRPQQETAWDRRRRERREALRERLHQIAHPELAAPPPAPVEIAVALPDTHAAASKKRPHPSGKHCAESFIVRDPEALAELKAKLHGHFRDADDQPIPISALARMTHISRSMLATLMSQDIKANPRSRGSLSIGIKLKLDAYLSATHASPQTCQQFEDDFQAMCRLTGYQPQELSEDEIEELRRTLPKPDLSAGVIPKRIAATSLVTDDPDRFAQLKANIYRHFTDENGQPMKFAQLAAATGADRGALVALMSPDSSIDPRAKYALGPSIERRLTEYLTKQGAPMATLEQFARDMRAMHAYLNPALAEAPALAR